MAGEAVLVLAGAVVVVVVEEVVEVLVEEVVEARGRTVLVVPAAMDTDVSGDFGIVVDDLAATSDSSTSVEPPQDAATRTMPKPTTTPHTCQR